MHIDTEKLRSRLDRVIWNIEAARLKVNAHHIVHMVGVSKYTDVDHIAALYRLGQRAFGENQVQQLKVRSHALDALPIEWHMIGTLQKNKITALLDLRPALLHSLDGIALAEALHTRLESRDTALACLLQINAAGEASKSGVAPDAAVDVYQEIRERFPRIELKGVMTIGAHSEDHALVRKSFETTHAVYTQLQHDGAHICSMGMSGDYPLAIACGSNMVRIGSALFR